jgi:hypothetical protein
LQKTILTGAFALVLGTSVYEVRRADSLQKHVGDLLRQQTPLQEKIAQLQKQNRDAASKIALTLRENQRLQEIASEVPRLRGEVTQAHQQSRRTASSSSSMDGDDRAMRHFLEAKAQAEQITRYLQQMPEKNIPELALLTDVDWLATVKEAKFDSDADIRKTLQKLRFLAKPRLPLGQALISFIQANNGYLPDNLSELKSFVLSNLGTPLPDETIDQIFKRYTLLHTGKITDLPADAWMIAETAPVDKDYDSRAKFGSGRSSVITTGVHEAGDPDDPSY